MEKQKLLNKLDRGITKEEDYIDVLANTYQKAFKKFYGDELDPKIIELMDKIINDSKNHKKILKQLYEKVEKDEQSDY